MGDSERKIIFKATRGAIVEALAMTAVLVLFFMAGTAAGVYGYLHLTEYACYPEDNVPALEEEWTAVPSAREGYVCVYWHTQEDENE
jgi:hypothetical protein